MKLNTMSTIGAVIRYLRDIYLKLVYLYRRGGRRIPPGYPLLHLGPPGL